MFTGLIEEIGTVTEAEPLQDGRRFRIASEHVLDGLRLGDSISVDGACHTVTRVHPNGFEVQSVATTLQRTTFGAFGPGTRVNLERALALGERLGGHLVQGHVDAVGVVRSIEPRGEHTLIDFTVPPIVAEVTILHGSITLNGISLTVNALPDRGVAQVSIIPHTWQATNLPDLSVGSRVNLEGDLIGKYVRSLLERPASSEQEDPPQSAEHLRRIWGY